jgi:MtN3 and saliva related transmembrane protein
MEPLGQSIKSGRRNLPAPNRAGPRGERMELLAYVGTAAAICTTTAFIPQILKIRRQGGNDLSYPMLCLYLTGILLWLAYGVMIHAAAVIWANAATALLVLVALVLKATHPAARRAQEERRRSNLAVLDAQPAGEGNLD